MSILLIIQIIVAILLTILILMQSQGSGLGSAWGGSNQSYHTKRGVEKVVFNGTIVLGILFTVLAVAALL